MSVRPHPLVAVLDAAAGGRFPPADGRIEVLPHDEDGTVAVAAFTGHGYVLADVDPADVVARARDAGAGGFGGALKPEVLTWLAGDDRRVGSIDAVLVQRGGGHGVDGVRVADDLGDHPRVRRAAEHRRDVAVFGNEDGVVILGRGLVGRGELSVELHDPDTASPGAGRRLIRAGLAHVPAAEWCWAQVSPGNARSLRAFLACGFTPIGSEVLITARRHG